MIMAILSSRIRSWLLFAILLPIVGRILQLVGVRVADRNPKVGNALSKAGGFARQPLGRSGQPPASTTRSAT